MSVVDETDEWMGWIDASGMVWYDQMIKQQRSTVSRVIAKGQQLSIGTRRW
jgi:hypothetical protein